MSATLTSTNTLNTYGLPGIRAGKSLDIDLVPKGARSVGYFTLSIDRKISDKAFIRSGAFEDIECVSENPAEIAKCITEIMGKSARTTSVICVVRDAIANVNVHKNNLDINVNW